MAETTELGNQELAAVFQDIATRLELKGENAFKIRAYRKGAEAIAGLDHDIRQEWQAGRLQSIPGIGEAIAGKLDELLRTGRLGFLERLAAEVPDEIVRLTRVPEIGPKTARAIFAALGPLTLDQLATVAREGKLSEVEGIGAKTEARILAGIEALAQRQQTPQRTLLGVAWPRAETLLATLREEAGTLIQRAEIAGSLRRRRNTASGIRLVLATRQPAEVAALIARLPQTAELLDRSPARVRARLHSGDLATFSLVPPTHWGTALQYHTGSRAHNQALAALARARGLQVGPHDALADAFPDEEALYARLDLPWIPPELREGQGEIEAAQEDDLPPLLTLEDLRGDLHMHSTWSDGQASIADMAAAARARGYEYIVIADHSFSLRIAGGLDVEKLGQQRIEIVNVNAKYNDFRVLQGAEVEIRPDGTLDYPDEVLAMLDVVVASLHSGLRQDRDTVTRRALAALENPHVDILAHPTGRLLDRRQGAALDIEEVIRVAAETGTALEINSQIDRLDLDPIHARAALEMGCLLTVNSDAHHPDGLAVIQYGVWQARRAWATPDDILNTRPLAEFLDYIHRDEEDEEDDL
jgi:DNA polymerase (family 10)